MANEEPANQMTCPKCKGNGFIAKAPNLKVKCKDCKGRGKVDITK